MMLQNLVQDEAQTQRDSPGPPDGVQEGPSQPSDPPFPWRGLLAPYDIGLPRAEVSFRPNLTRAPPDRAAEREADNFFSRPYFAQHFGATRNMSASVVTHRIQAWDFTHYNIPEISDSAANVVVRKCKIHNDASVDISVDGTMLAALVPESQAMTMVGVYSLREKSRGQLLYSYIFAPNTICVSLSPVARHLVVGFASHTPRFVSHHNTKQVVAQIYKLCDNPMFYGRGQAGHLQFLRDIEVMSDHRHTSLNCIRWLPYPGQGLIYGTNRGQLNILR
nr:activating molecule in BECN1-regulated autophagy protein 1-like [Penaeus vannamei]